MSARAPLAVATTAPQRGADAATSAAVSVAWVVIATLGMLFRSTTAPGLSWWAEDGAIFFSDALRYPVATNLRLAYNGYLQTGGRIVAEIAVLFPRSSGPLAMTICSEVAVALLSVYVWRASSEVFTSRWAPVLAGALLVVVPQAGPETTGFAADLHWYLDICCFWALVRPPTSRWVVASSSAVSLLAVLSDPLALLMLVPAVVSLVVDRRDDALTRRRIALLGAPLLGGLLQLVAGHGSAAYTAPLSVGGILRFGVVRLGEAPVVGERWVAGVYDHTRTPFAAAMAAAALALFLLALRRVGRRRAALAGTWVAIGAAFVVVCLRTRGGELIPSAQRFSYDGSRYTLVPVLLMWAAAALLVEELVAKMDAGSRRMWLRIGGGLVAASLAANWYFPSLRKDPISWSAQEAEARMLCAEPAATRVMPPAKIKDVGSPRPQPDASEVSVLSDPHSSLFHDFVIVLPCSSVASR